MKTQNKALILTIAITVLSTVLAVVGYMVLPETIVTQVSFSGGASSTMPKLFGLGLPFLLSTVFAVSYYRTRNGKNLIISVVGLIVYALVFYFNL